ncbi:ComEC/Rec2 family competence protein [Ferviditalea candida]|uniref:ComEC/Rec2 family competence protein n=1 Tax=Ferviditalea candida TaxID=3108399 RepID=A0ABU5ZHF9_9BACL|nr:ComEC/Rec2 family competence protein [Paenibacillaceae bacterium T2]
MMRSERPWMGSEFPRMGSVRSGMRSKFSRSNHAGSKALTLFLAVCLFILLTVAYRPDVFNRQGEVDFLNVGQGDGILIRTPSHRVLLVDGGGTLSFGKKEEWMRRKDPYEVGRKLLVPLLKQRGIQKLDALIVSHADADHIGGLQAVLEEIPVKRMLFNGTLKQSANAKKLFQLALDRHIPLYPIHAGMKLQVDGFTELNFLYPVAEEKQATTNSSVLHTENQQNAYCVVFWMRMYHSTFLFTGDMDQAAEAEIVQADPLAEIMQKETAAGGNDGGNRSTAASNGSSSRTRVDVLKVAHHGSKTSTSEAWLDYWRPLTAVISVGRNNVYGHPNPQVLERLQAEASAVYRTDLDGEVQFRVAPNGLRVRKKLHRVSDAAIQKDS